MEPTLNQDKLHTLRTEVHGMEATLRDYKRELNLLMVTMVNDALDQKEGISNTCGSCGCGPQHLSRRLVISHWDCSKSPIDTCVYELNKDPWHDECVFCGESEERT